MRRLRGNNLLDLHCRWKTKLTMRFRVSSMGKTPRWAIKWMKVTRFLQKHLSQATSTSVCINQSFWLDRLAFKLKEFMSGNIFRLDQPSKRSFITCHMKLSFPAFHWHRLSISGINTFFDLFEVCWFLYYSRVLDGSLSMDLFINVLLISSLQTKLIPFKSQSSLLHDSVTLILFLPLWYNV